MPLNTVTLTWDLADLIESGLAATITLVPTAVLTDAADHVVIPEVTRSCVFTGGTGQLAGIIACDDSQITPAGWAYTITVVSYNGQVIVPAFNAFINFANGATQDLSALTPVEAVTTMAAYLPLPGGTAVAGDVPVATGSGTATQWGSGGGGGGMANPMTTLGDMIEGGSAGAATRLPGNTAATRKFLRSAGTGSVATAPAWDTLQAGDIPALSYDAAGAASAAQAAAETYADTNKLAKSADLSDLANASTARTNLGLGTAATQNSSAFDTAGAASAAQAAAEAASLPITGGTMTGWLAPAVAALTQSAGNVAVNAALGNVFTLTLTASGWTIKNPTAPADGQIIRFRLTQDATGGRTITWDTAYDFGSGSAPALTATASKTDIAAFEYVAALSKWCYLGAAIPQGF